MAYELWLLRRGLKNNRRRRGAVLLPTLGAGNWLTLLRGLILGLLAGFLLAPWPEGELAWLPAILYTFAAVADTLDGYLARITGHATSLGETLDIEFDALGLLIATSLTVRYGQLPWWYLLLGAARYLFILGIWWRKRQGKPVYHLPHSATRRMIAGFHMGFTTVMLWPIVRPPGTFLAGIVFAVPFVTSFARDWLIVSGRLDPASPLYQKVRRKLVMVLVRWLPVFLRAVVVIAAAGLISSALRSTSMRIAMFAWPGLPDPEFTSALMIFLALGAIALLSLGVAGRVAALGLIAVTAANIFASGLRLRNGVVLALAIAVMFLGTGAFSVWRPEDTFLSRRAGEQRDSS